VAFDVYVGPLARFYRRDWENAGQRWAKSQGITHEVIHVGGDTGAPPPADEMRRLVEGWGKALDRSLKPHGIETFAWDESDCAPYFTERPNWDGYSAMLTWAAHEEHPDLPLPVDLPDPWTDDPAYIRSVANNSGTRYRTILEPQVWLPMSFPFVFEAPTLVTDKCCIGSVFTLRQQLDDLFTRSKTQMQGTSRSQTDGDHAGKEVGFLARILSRKHVAVSPEKSQFFQAAEYGLTIFRELASKACEYQLPMALDY
jgi:hypothetical protein